MRAYTQLLVQTCHRRGAHAIGGMSAFIPNRREPEVTTNALEQVRIDKEREAGDGFDGTWVAHPDLVPVAAGVFNAVLGQRPNQKERLRPDVSVTAPDLLSVQIPGGEITEAGVRLNVGVALQYVASWLDGNGAAAINNLMEDAATAEISRSQLWQWLHHAVSLSDGREMTRDLYASVRAAELSRLESAYPGFRWTDAAAILDALVLDDSFQPFLTLLAYPYLD
jgi:malate synthase